MNHQHASSSSSSSTSMRKWKKEIWLKFRQNAFKQTMQHVGDEGGVVRARGTGRAIGRAIAQAMDEHIDTLPLSVDAITRILTLRRRPTLGRMTMKSTRPFARSLACTLALLSHSLAPHCSLRSCALLRSFIRSLIRFGAVFFCL